MGRRKAYDTGEVLNAIAGELGAEADEIELTDGPELDQPAVEPVIADPAVEEEKKEDEAPPAEATTEEPKPWADEYASLKAELDYTKGMLERQAQPTPPAPQAPAIKEQKRLREIEDADEYAERMESLERNATAAYAAIRQLELNNASKAMQELKAEYPDIDQIIKKEHLESGIEARLKAGSLGVDWKEPMLRVYDVATNNRRHVVERSRLQELEEENKRLRDEVAQKRAERQRKEQESRTAGMVPAGGSVYQPTMAPKSSQPGSELRGRAAYKAAAEAMTRALAQTGG